MNSKTISVCGSPYAGKATLIAALRKYMDAYHQDMIYSEDNPNLLVDGITENIFFRIITRSGAYKEYEAMPNKILKDTDIVIYVLEAHRTNSPKRLTLDQETHRYFADIYIHEAKNLKKTWFDIPWILVLNKIDVASQIPDESILFPEKLVSSIIQCSSIHQIGVDHLWGKLIEYMRY